MIIIDYLFLNLWKFYFYPDLSPSDDRGQAVAGQLQRRADGDHEEAGSAGGGRRKTEGHERNQQARSWKVIKINKNINYCVIKMNETNKREVER